MAAHRERLKVLFLSYADESADDSRVAQIVLAGLLRATKLEASQVTVFPVTARAITPSALAGMDAVIIGGAKWSVWEDVPNQAATIETIRAARDKKLPTLGICYGAQLLAHVFGGQVAADKAGAEWGTFDIEATDDAFGDILFADAPFTFAAQQAHNDCITKAPPSALVLASSSRCAIEAFSIPGADMYGLQFHPERSKSDYEAVLAIRGEAYSGGSTTSQAIRASLRETPDAEALLATFIDRIVLARR